MNEHAATLPVEMRVDDLVTHGTEWGDISVRLLNLPAGTDFTPFFAGLPDDLCPSSHWGYILEGSIHVRYKSGREEHARAGDVYWWPAGHTGWTDEGVVFVEFSPATHIRPVLAHLAGQLEA